MFRLRLQLFVWLILTFATKVPVGTIENKIFCFFFFVPGQHVGNKTHVLSISQRSLLFLFLYVRLQRLCCLFLRTDHYTLMETVTLFFISVTVQEQKVWSAPTIILLSLEPFDMHQSMYAQGNNIVAFIKVQGIQIRNKLITFNLMICMQIFPFLSRYRYYHGNCKTHTAKKK